MFRRILIANRGEIALRIIRACRELGVESVCVYSTADKDAPYLKLADRAICIGPPPARESYINIPKIIAAAEIADVDAIHPGYGFLSERADFAQICRDCKIEFIGPSPEAMAQAGRQDLVQEDGQAPPRCRSSRFRGAPSTTRKRASSDRLGRSATPSSSRRLRRRRRARHEASAHNDVATPARESPKSARQEATRSLRQRRLCTSRSSSSTRAGTSRSRCWATSTATRCTSSSATARPSGGTRS